MMIFPSKSLDKILGSFVKVQKELNVFIEQTKTQRYEIQDKVVALNDELSGLVTKQYKAEQVLTNITKLLG